ncbi:hypothetical protein ABT173_10310 [Streptomyces sp. NPDC001795]|uniref:hypothetical protein n=1 Tax=Streptomyces sp. NPDC001795 TaxID=3154525 RepID=UPI00332B3BC8
MAKAPTVIGVLTEPTAPTWWKANRHKVFGVTGLLIGYMVGTHLHGAPEQRPDNPGRATPRPHRPHPERTARTRPTASPTNQPHHPRRAPPTPARRRRGAALSTDDWRNCSCSLPARAAGSAGPDRSVPAPATRTAPGGCPAPGAGDGQEAQQAAPREEARAPL